MSGKGLDGILHAGEEVSLAVPMSGSNPRLTVWEMLGAPQNTRGLAMPFPGSTTVPSPRFIPPSRREHLRSPMGTSRVMAGSPMVCSDSTVDSTR